MTHHLHPNNLEKYSFMWSEARLLVAAVALLLGGVSPILLVVPASFEFTVTLLKLAWLVSGVASLYLAYRWYSAKQTLFGKKDGADTLAFFVMVVSGINLGLTGALGQNIGMSILSGRTVFFVVALLYLWTAYHLWKRWNSHGKKLF